MGNGICFGTGPPAETVGASATGAASTGVGDTRGPVAAVSVAAGPEPAPVQAIATSSAETRPAATGPLTIRSCLITPTGNRSLIPRLIARPTSRNSAFRRRHGVESIHGMLDALGHDRPYGLYCAGDGFVHRGAFARPGHPENVLDLFFRRGRLADSNSHPLVFVRADGRSYRLKALVPACAPLLSYTYGADGQVYVVRNYDQPLRGGPVSCEQILRRFAAQVDIRTRQGQDRGVASDVYLACADERLFSSVAPVSSTSR